ncbi:MAG: AlwI family type II restriction endonuclease [Treponema sp.]|nr:AlwI family type II restriction endonuclease [Treponema sp.]
MPRADEYKPLLLTTTVRNPERYKTLLSVLLAYNGEILTNEIIDKVIFNMVSKKLYVPVFVSRTPRLKEQLIDEGTPFSVSDTQEIIENSPQNHKEAGFDKGWPSRFDTFFKMAMELGFLYYAMNEPIEFSDAGIKLVKSIENEFVHLENQVFLNAFVKYQRVNPFRRVKNENKPLILLLQTIKELSRIYGETSAGIARQEIPLILCWPDDDYTALLKQISEIREEYNFAPSGDYIYEICKKLLGVKGPNAEIRFKKINILREMPDEFIRKMRLTGLISIRGNGRFIDNNTLEAEKIEYVLSCYATSIQQFSTARECYDYMKVLDMSLISREAVVIASETEKERLFTKWVNTFELDTIKNELIIVCTPHKSSQNEILKFINEPARLEFLAALALKKTYPELSVVPNYVIDDEGLPISFAPGGGADIVCHDNIGNILFEVTLLTGVQQNIREMPAIERHLKEIAAPNSFSVMLCPRAHTDTLSYSAWLRDCKNITVSVVEIPHFAETLGIKTSARETYFAATTPGKKRTI